MVCALLVASAAFARSSSDAAPVGPSSQALVTASDGSDWLVPGGQYSGNRMTTLSSITKHNVAQLRKAWVTALRDDGEQEASPLIYHGMMYVSTPHDNVVALDAATGKVRWAFPYNPSYVILYAVNRGVGIADGKVFLATQDCRVIALDAMTGKRVWNVQGCRAPATTQNSWYSMAAYVYKGKVIVGTAGGDAGDISMVSAFDASSGKRLWDWHTVPLPGEPNFGTWPGKSWQHGGASVWAGLSLDPSNDTLYIAPGNAGPNLTLYGRKGTDLYSDSVVALDIRGNKPRVKWYYQILKNDTHDADPAMPPTEFDGTVAGKKRQLLAVGDKAGDFVILDRTNGHVVYRMAVSKQTNILSTQPSIKGTFACPNHGGGIEWNGGSYDPKTNVFLVPSTQECASWKRTTNGAVAYIPGQPYSAGPLPKRQPATGMLSAIDVSNGTFKWRDPLPYSGQGGVLVAPGGLAFTTDLRGRMYGFDTASGKVLWHDDTGSAIVAPLSAYAIGATEYLVVVAGEGGNQKTPNLPAPQGSRIVAYRLNAPRTVMNQTSGQPAVLATTEKTESSAGASAAVAVPYTNAQVATGQKVYTQACLSCHGANLQGISGPALTGASFAHAHLNVSQIRTIVTQQMPLTAPGSLKPDAYAAVMAYLLKRDCIKASGGDKTPFPTSDQPMLAKAYVAGSTCPVR